MSDSYKVSEENERALSHVREMLASLQFGTISIIVQNNKIVQLEKNEKWRAENGRK